MTMTAADIAAALAAASEGRDSTKPPMFQEADPERWFITLESYFNTRSITDKSRMFDVMWSRLTESQMTSVGNAWFKAAAASRYATVKAALIKRYALTQTQRFDRLSNMPALGTALPSHRLMEMRTLAGAELEGNDYFNYLYYKSLPQNIVNLYRHAASSLDEFAELADHFVRHNPPTSAAPLQVSAAQSKPSDLCFYHAKYGSQARKCRKGECRMRNEPLAPAPATGNATASR